MQVCTLLTSRSQCRGSDNQITVKAHGPFISWYFKKKLSISLFQIINFFTEAQLILRATTITY